MSVDDPIGHEPRTWSRYVGGAARMSEIDPLERDRGGYRVPERLADATRPDLGVALRVYRVAPSGELIPLTEPDVYRENQAEILRLKAEVVELREACWQLWDTACPVMTTHGFKWPVPKVLDKDRARGAESRP